MRKLFIIFTLVSSAFATNYTVKAGGGGSFTTIAACMTAMSSSGGDTCTVFAGTYTESPTIKAGTAGNYNVLTVNGADVVTLTGHVTVSSHTKLVGNCAVKLGTVTSAACGFFVSNPSSPTTSCLSGSSVTDAFVLSNNMYACGGVSFTGPSTNVIFSGNSVAYTSDTVSSLNSGPTFPNVACNGCLFELNDLSHASDVWNEITGSNNVFRKNSLHDNLASECGSNSGNCHIDGFFSEGSTATKNNIFELNTYYNCNSTGFSGAGCHMILQQADACAGNCAQTVWRFNQGVNVYTAGLENDNAWKGMYGYNNTYVDVANSHGGTGGGGIGDSCDNSATNCNYLNNIYYYSGTLTDFNAIGVTSGGVMTRAAANIAFCTVACTGLHGTTYGSGTWTGSGQILTNPLLVSPNSAGTALGNNALQSGSPARNAGTFLTTVNGTIVSSTTLVVADAGFFQANTSIPGVQADCIAVTTITNKVCITAVNYTTQSLTLASPISATSGDHIWIYSLSDGTRVLTDTTGPDIGAVPFGIVQPRCGPPAYACSTTSTAPPGVIAPIFLSTDPVNTVRYDSTLNLPPLNPYSRLTDGTTFTSGASVGGMTCTGGANPRQSSINEDYILLSQGGSVFPIQGQIATDGSWRALTTGHLTSFIVCPAVFSGVVDTRFYSLSNAEVIKQNDFTSGISFNTTTVQDVSAAGICPGIDFTSFGGTPTTGSGLEVSLDDQTFTWAVAPNGGGQGTAVWVVSWNRTLGCSAVNFNTGQVWNWCTSSCTPATPPSGTLSGVTTCYGAVSPHGIHDIQTSMDGHYSWVSLNGTTGPWTAGSCNGSAITTQYSIWQNGTTGDQWAYDATGGAGGAQAGGHDTLGMTHTLTPYDSGPNIRLNSNVTSFTTFATTGITSDKHCAWPHPNGDDSYPWVCASDLALDADNSGCAVHALCPIWLRDVIFAWYPNAINQAAVIFGHTFSCNEVLGTTYANCAGGTGDAYFGGQNAIGFVSAKGNFYFYASTMLNSLGNDNLGNPRQDAFAIGLDQPFTPIVWPVTSLTAIVTQNFEFNLNQRFPIQGGSQ